MFSGFDNSVAPPFPWLMTTLTNPSKTSEQKVKGYIDTGSDGSAIPIKLGQDLGLFKYPIARAEISGLGGKLEQRILYGLVIEIAGQDVAIAVDIRDDLDFVLLGRDILQYFSLMIDWRQRIVRINP